MLARSLKTVFPLVLYLFVSAAASASDHCASIRLDSIGGSMEFVRSQTQGNFNICTFSAMSQMIDAFLYSHAAPDTAHVTSPLALSIQRHGLPISREGNYGYRVNGLFFEYGNSLCWDFNALKDAELGSCSEAGLIERFRQIANADKGFSDFFNGFSRSLRKEQHYIGRVGSSDGTAPGKVGESMFYVRENMWRILTILGGVSGLKQFVASTCDTPETKRLDFGCFSAARANRMYPIDQDYALKAIHKQLSGADAQPIRLDICQELLERRDGASNRGIVFEELRDCAGTSAGHTVLAIGRRRGPDNKCQILVRNSQGTSCRNYGNPRNCEDGDHYWIGEDDLRGSIRDIAWFIPNDH